MDDPTSRDETLDLSERKVEEREASPLNCTVFSKVEMKAVFDDAISTINANLAEAINLEGRGNIELAKSIYRYLVASLESAFDYLIHCVLKYGVERIFLGQANQTERYKSYLVPLSVVQQMSNACDSDAAKPLINFVNERSAADTYLNYDAFKNALNMVDAGLVGAIADDLYSGDCSMLKSFMVGLYKRRNLIVHQDDRENVGGAKQDITDVDVAGYRDGIIDIVDAIFRHLY